MKALLWLSAVALLLGLPVAQAQQVLAASSTAPPPGSGLPPPGINAPGAKPIPLPSTKLRPSVAPAAREQKDANGNTSDVAVSTDASGDTIQEYSRNGTVYMVRITPKHGVTQTYIYDSPNGSLVHDPQLGPVAPVYYTLFKWGARKPASAESSAAPAQPPSSSG